MDVLSRKWTNRFISLAREVASWSKDTTKVGAVIVTMDGDPVSFGYNGFPRGVKESTSRTIRPVKYNYMVHAERNAIYLSRSNLKNTVMFVTHKPCPECAKAIAQSGISHLVVDEKFMDGIDPESSMNGDIDYTYTNNILRESGVEVYE